MADKYFHVNSMAVCSSDSASRGVGVEEADLGPQGHGINPGRWDEEQQHVPSQTFTAVVPLSITPNPNCSQVAAKGRKTQYRKGKKAFIFSEHSSNYTSIFTPAKAPTHLI